MLRLVLCKVLLLAALPLGAQQPLPKPPKLPSGLDTLDARSYFQWGLRRDVNWKKALEAFRWAGRLEPDNADYRYATYLALFNRQSPEWRNLYYEGVGFVVNSKEARQVDSARVEVWLRDPFAHFRGPCYLIEGLERQRDRFAVGFVHYETGCFPQAVAAWEEALAKDSSLVGLHEYIARAKFYAEDYTGAVQSLQVVLDTLRARDAEHLVRWYESKAMYEYMTAAVHMAARRHAAARDALGRTLMEDLAFHQAHIRLGEVALADGDLETASTEFTLARDLAPEDAVTHERLGEALVRLKHYAEAEAPLREAIRLEPLWLKPRYQLGLALVGAERFAEAEAVFEGFIARCPKRLSADAALAERYLVYARDQLVQGESQ